MSVEIERPDNVCPNCWGHQNYDHQIREKLKDEQIDVNNKKLVRSFIQEWVVQNLTGSKLKNEMEYNCVACGKDLRVNHL